MEKAKGREGGGLAAFSLTDAAFSTDSFRVWEFKVKRCPRSRPHDWTQCPFAHPSEKAKRRDPRRYKYSGTACPDFRKNGTCRRGDACEFAHGVFECWLHPARYRTQICTDGMACKRRVCFFAHHEGELRKVDDEGAPSSGKDADLLAEAQAYQKQLAALASSLPANGDLSSRFCEAQRGAGRRVRVEMQPVADAGLGEQARAIQAQALAQALVQAQAGAAGCGGPLGGGSGAPLAGAAGLASAAAALLGMDGAALLQLVAANQAQVQQQVEAELLQRCNAEAQRRSFEARRSLDALRPGRASLDLPRTVSAGLDAPYGGDYGVDYGDYGAPAGNMLAGVGYSVPTAHSNGGGGQGFGLGPGHGQTDGSLESLVAGGAAAAAFSQRRCSVDGLLEARGGDAGVHARRQAYAAALAAVAPLPPPFRHAAADALAAPPAPLHGHRRSVDMGALARAGPAAYGAFSAYAGPEAPAGGHALGSGPGYPVLDRAELRLPGRPPSSYTSSASSDSSESAAAPAVGNPNTIPEGAQWLCGTGGGLGGGGPGGDTYVVGEAGAAKVLYGGFPMMAGRAPVGEFLVRNASFDSIIADMPRSISELNLAEQVGASSALIVNGGYDKH